jgi:hypothetical protein
MTYPPTEKQAHEKHLALLNLQHQSGQDRALKFLWQIQIAAHSVAHMPSQHTHKDHQAEFSQVLKK